MKFKVSDPITIGKLTYSTAQMVAYVTKTDRVYASSASGARDGKRVAAAFEDALEVELADEDLRLLAARLDKPSAGWGEFWADREMPVRATNGAIEKQVMRSRVQIPAIEFLPLIDPITNAAAALPPLANK